MSRDQDHPPSRVDLRSAGRNFAGALLDLCVIADVFAWFAVAMLATMSQRAEMPPLTWSL